MHDRSSLFTGNYGLANGIGKLKQKLDLPGLSFGILPAEFSVTDAMRCPIKASALSTLIRQRPPTPSRGGPGPYRGENSGPGRTIVESLTPTPELENGIGQLQPILTADLSVGCQMKSRRRRTES